MLDVLVDVMHEIEVTKRCSAVTGLSTRMNFEQKLRDANLRSLLSLAWESSEHMAPHILQIIWGPSLSWLMALSYSD